MRIVWSIPLLLATAVMAFPLGSAEPGDECAEQNVTGRYVDDDHLQVNLRRDCSLEVVALEGIVCVGGWGGVIERDIDRHTVRAHYCTGGAVPDIALQSTMPGCKRSTHEFEDNVQGVKHTIEVHHNCRVDVTLNEGITCVGAWTATDTYVVGPITVENHRCAMPGGDPALTSSAGIRADPCNGIWYATGSKTLPTGTTVSYGTNLQPGCTFVRAEHGPVDCTFDSRPDCQDIWINAMACLWGSSYKTVKAGLMNVHIYTCDNRPPNAVQSRAADPLPEPTCGIVYHEVEVGPVTIGHSLPCIGASIDYEWGPLPEDSTPNDWEGGVGLCASDAFGSTTCKTVTT